MPVPSLTVAGPLVERHWPSFFPLNSNWLMRSMVAVTLRLPSQCTFVDHALSSTRLPRNAVPSRFLEFAPLCCCCCNFQRRISHTVRTSTRLAAYSMHHFIVLSPLQTKGPFLALVSGLQNVLDACPAMPGVALETSIQDCLRRPSPAAAAWSLDAARMFAGGVLSLVSRSPRSMSLCQAVVSVLVRFVAEKGCGLAGE